MKALKIKLYQELVNYRKPYSYNFLESYPLPSFSMIKGWIYTTINSKEKDRYYEETICDLKIGISGIVSGLTHDLQHFIKIGNMRDFEKTKEDLKIRTPTYVTLISSIHLSIYINAGDKLIKDFQNNMFNVFPSLGRYEDLANIEFCKFVELKEKNFSKRNSHNLHYYTYISENKAKALENIQGSWLRVPTTYQVENDIRYFNRENVLCLSDGCMLSEGTFFIDDSDPDGERIVDLILLKI